MKAYATIGSPSSDEGENFFAIRWKSRKLIYDAEISVRTCKFIQIARISRSLSAPRWEEKSFRHEKCKFAGSRLICIRLQLRRAGTATQNASRWARLIKTTNLWCRRRWHSWPSLVQRRSPKLLGGNVQIAAHLARRLRLRIEFELKQFADCL